MPDWQRRIRIPISDPLVQAPTTSNPNSFINEFEIRWSYHLDRLEHVLSVGCRTCNQQSSIVLTHETLRYSLNMTQIITRIFSDLVVNLSEACTHIWRAQRDLEPYVLEGFAADTSTTIAPEHTVVVCRQCHNTVQDYYKSRLDGSILCVACYRVAENELRARTQSILPERIAGDPRSDRVVLGTLEQSQNASVQLPQSPGSPLGRLTTSRTQRIVPPCPTVRR